MKLSPRITIPIALALVLSAVIGVLFLWQIRASVRTIESGFLGGKNTTLGSFFGSTTTKTPAYGEPQVIALLREGELLEYKGEWAKAEEKYAASVQGGGGVPALKKLAAIQLQRREFTAAEQTIGALRKDNSESPDAVFLEGILRLRSGDSAGAVQAFNQLPSSPSSHYGLSIVAMQSGDHEGAKAELARAVEGSDAAVRNAANVLRQAYDEFALFPNGEDIHLQTLLARALAEVGECETALGFVKTVVTEQSRYRDAWIVKGYCEFVTERTQDALASLEQAYSIDPEKAEIQYFLSRVHKALGDTQNAVTFLQYAVINGFEPQKDARSLLADYAVELGNKELALEQLKALIDAKDVTLSAYADYVSLAVTMENHIGDAVDASKKALEKWPDQADAFAINAEALFAAGQTQQAKDAVSRALSIDPKNQKAIAVSEKLK